MCKQLMILAAVVCVGLVLSTGCDDDEDDGGGLGGPGAIAEVDGVSCEFAVDETAAWYLAEDDWQHFGMAGLHDDSCMFEIEAAYYDGSWDAAIFFASSSGEVEDGLILDSFEFEEADGELTGSFSGVFASDDQIAVSVEFEAIPWSEDTF